ncbi:hypothetical protein YTPLAS18_20180 [Nitrospira sp.]|nr:hypothetical protein YTPLAS18_20180 [Nitrospira sp.]
MSHHAPGNRPANRLIHETSPYLLQHAHNPVDWYPWGPEALAVAKQQNRPILLSIGYSACHWCHVMERESFENEDIASVMNQYFVCIKVDREERPDLDEIYMQATVTMNNGHGGWPMTVFLTPEQQPIFAGTYFPPTDRYGRPGFKSVLVKVAEVWKQDAAGLREQAAQFTDRLKREVHVSAPVSIGDAELTRAVEQFREDFDDRYGGFGSAPKFPPATGLSLLIRASHRRQDPNILNMVRKTLDAMAAGGIYDHVGGGFARYSTDEKWLVPHFEKMLYDNALLAKVYVEAFQVTRESRYRRVAQETLDYVLREMTGPESRFYSATDADSEGVEGKFFVWTPNEILAAVGDEEDARRFCAYYDITPAGNFEHANIPNTPEPLQDIARRLSVSAEDLQTSLDRARAAVYAARAKRVSPGLDDKTIVSWNGLMISALAEGARVLGTPQYRVAATRAADFLLAAMRRPDGRLFRTYRMDRPQHAACLEDYACLCEGLIDLYEAGANESYLRSAVELAEIMVQDFRDDERGGFYTTGASHEALIVRGREGPDGATPSANAVAAFVLARLSFHYGRNDWRQIATTAIRIYGRAMGRYPRAFAKSLIVADFLLARPVELALIGTPGEAGYEALAASINAQYLPNRVVAHHAPSDGVSSHPLLAGKTLVADRAAVYVCKDFACQTPMTRADDLPAMLGRSMAGDANAPDSRRSLTGARITGSATSQGTGAYASRHLAAATRAPMSVEAYTNFGETGWTTSRLGFGCYRIDTQEPGHREALIKALRQGSNVIDTSTNYSDGDSERLVGSVLAELTRKQEVQRQEVVLISKIGYIQGQNHKHAEQREREGHPYPEMVKYGEELWHCLHPLFLADQLELSLDRLDVDTLDVCLLHNPEYFLLDAVQRGQRELEPLRDEFYRRLRVAFEYFERQVAAGRIRFYGVSSNTVTGDPALPETISVSRMWDTAQEAARAEGQAVSHFAVLQCPINLFESRSALIGNAGEAGRETVLQYAQKKRLAVLANRPLNASPGQANTKGAIIRLADPVHETVTGDRKTQFATIAALEAEYRRDIAPHVPYAGQGLAPSEYFTWAEELSRVWEQVSGIEHWEHIETQMVAPHLSQVIRALGQVLTNEQADRWDAWRERYVPAFLELLRLLRHEAAERSRHRLGLIHAALDPLIPEHHRAASLSQLALWVVASTPGVTCVLNGMRSPAYVQDSMTILHWSLLPHPVSVYEKLEQLALP